MQNAFKPLVMGMKEQTGWTNRGHRFWETDGATKGADGVGPVSLVLSGHFLLNTIALVAQSLQVVHSVSLTML